jgi:hypothetical protein
VWRVKVEPWVEADLAGIGLSRLTLNGIHFDLHNYLPTVLSTYQQRRIPGSPRCFWYSRTYVDGFWLHWFDFVVRDATPGLLEVIWVLHTS